MRHAGFLVAQKARFAAKPTSRYTECQTSTLTEIVIDTKAANDRLLQDITQLSEHMWLFNALGCAVELGIFDVVDDKGASCDVIASKLNLHAPTVSRLMRALAANGYFKAEDAKTYTHSESSRALRRDAQPSMRSMVQLGNIKPMQEAWQYLGETLHDGKSAWSHAHGKELYQSLAGDKHIADVFNTSMTALSQGPIRDVSEQYTDFGRCNNVLDVAGGVGHLLAAILKRYPSVHGAVLDMAHLQAQAKDYLKSAGCAERANYVAGNMMESLPTGYDCYMIKNALWNWHDEDAARVLRNMREALGTNKGRVVIIEDLITGDNLAQSSLFDLQMLVATPGGRTRSEKDYVIMAQKAGLRHERTLTMGRTQLLEFFPGS